MTQSVKVWLDKNFIQNTKGSGEILTQLENMNTTTIIDALPVEQSIFWTRSNVTDISDKKKNAGAAAATSAAVVDEVQHDHILVKLELTAFVELVAAHLAEPSNKHNPLRQFIARIKQRAQVTQLTLLVPDFKSYYKGLQTNVSEANQRENYNSLVGKTTASKKKAAPAKLTKSELNATLLCLELSESACVRSYESIETLRDTILSYTKAVSEYASKRELNDTQIFCDKAVDKSGSKVSKDGQGLIYLWKDCIECFPLVGPDQSQAICAAYGSPLALKRAYETADRGRADPMLLADIQVRRGAGVLSNVRRIGPELSKKLYKFLTSTNPNEPLVNE